MGALEAGRLTPPFSVLAVRRLVPGSEGAAVAGELQRLSEAGMDPAHLAYALRLALDERQAGQQAADRLELVWSGPEAQGSASRDTGVVVRELFAGAQRSVLVAGFAVEQGRAIFRVLAERMDACPEVSVRMFLNVARRYGDETVEAQLLKAFADDFRTHQWPGVRMPEVFYDPRALAPGRGPRASLHAKCIVVDDERVLVTSANFTEAAQERNIEVGVLARDTHLAKALRGQFETLVVAGQLRRVPGLG